MFYVFFLRFDSLLHVWQQTASFWTKLIASSFKLPGLVAADYLKLKLLDRRLVTVKVAPENCVIRDDVLLTNVQHSEFFMLVWLLVLVRTA